MRLKQRILLTFLPVILLSCQSLNQNGETSTTTKSLVDRDNPAHYLIRIPENYEAADLFDAGVGLIRMIPPERIDGNSGWWLAFITPEMADELTALGMEVILAKSFIPKSGIPPDGVEPLAPPDSCNSTPENGTFCPYDTTIPRCSTSILNEIENAPSTYPPVGGTTYIEVVNTGTTYQGRPIKGVRVGKLWKSGEPPVPQLIIISGQHSNEWGAVEMTMRLFRYYAGGYRDNVGDIRSVLSDRAIVFLPVSNPDGYQYTFTSDRDWRKNRVPCTGGYGVDVNRNFPFSWGEPGSSPDCPNISYRGPSAGSEAETSAIRNLIANANLTGQYRTGLVVNAHTYGNFLLFADGMSSGYSPCTTKSNCSPGDLGAFYKLVGTERTIKMKDEEVGRPYITGTIFRTVYETSGDQIKDSVYGTLPGGAPKVMAITPELTWTACTFYAEKLPPTQLASLFNIYQKFVHGLLKDVEGIADGGIENDVD